MDTPENSADKTDEHVRTETWQHGEYLVEATFAVRNGVETPWPSHAEVRSSELTVSLIGRNLLPRVWQIADMLHRNPIRD